MWEHIPLIIAEAAKSQLGILALIIIALSFIGFAFFRRADAPVKVGVFIFMFLGFGLFFFAGSRIEISQSAGQQVKQLDQLQPSLDAALSLNRADRFRSSGDNDKARDAYIGAASLYKAAGDLQGEADVLSDLGDLERQLGHIDSARQAYTEARILFEAIGDRRSELDVQLNLEGLEYQPDPDDKARETYVSGGPMNRIGLISYVASTSGLSPEAADKAVNAVFRGITETLANGNEVRLVGFGTFSVAVRKATVGRNPRTGERIQIPASRRPKFNPGKTLKEAVN